jgi:hypothetical protein
MGEVPGNWHLYPTRFRTAKPNCLVRSPGSDEAAVIEMQEDSEVSRNTDHASSPWINFEGMVAHPDSPRGGGGPGRFRVPSMLGAQGNDSRLVPHPHAPASRYRLLTAKEHLILLADNSPKTFSATAGSPREINFVGTFKSYWYGKPLSEILDAANKKNWFPDTIDLIEFAKKGSKGNPIQVANLNDLLYQIGKNKPGTIGRLNLFTHAVKGSVALSGVVAKNFVDWKDEDANTSQAIDDTQIEDNENQNKVFPWGGKITITDVRAAFRKDAVVVIYACNAGLDKPYLNKISKLFGVKVRGFSKMIVFNLIPDKSGMRIIKTTYSVEDSNQTVTDFHQLRPDVETP